MGGGAPEGREGGRSGPKNTQTGSTPPVRAAARPRRTEAQSPEHTHCACASRLSWRFTSTLRTSAMLVRDLCSLGFVSPLGAEAGKRQPPRPTAAMATARSHRASFGPAPRRWRRGMGRGQPVPDTPAPPTWALDARGSLLLL